MLKAQQLPLSVLDLAAIGPGILPEQALRDVVRVARTAEECGYHRFWVGEHHASPISAGSSPAVLLAHIAACTRTLRVGSGGVMLPNHAPLVVAEQFAVLQSLHPGRVDLGVGRSSGGSVVGNLLDEALHRHPLATSEFPELVDELIGFLYQSWPEGHRFRALKMSPRVETPPDVFVLGASENGARVAAQRGLPFVYGHHLGRGKARSSSVDRYRATFTAGPEDQRPYVVASVNVLCAETDAEGDQEAMRIALREVRRGHLAADKGNLVESRLRYLAGKVLEDAHLVRGGPETVRKEIHQLAAALDADEIMLVPYGFTAADRSRTLRLIAPSRPAMTCQAAGVV